MLQKITLMIYLIFVQYMKNRMQITQEHSEYDLMANSVKLCNKRLRNCQKVMVVFVT